MASTTHVDQWPRIPKPELLTALATRTARVARSDRDQDAPAAWFTVTPGQHVEARIPF